MMIRRMLFATAAAAALAVLPTAASAYEAPGIDFTVSDSTPDVGQAFTVAVLGAVVESQVTLTATGTPPAIWTTTASSSGAATFTITLGAEGTYTLSATSATGSLLGDSVVVVGSAGVGGSSVAVPPALALSATGFDSAGLAAGAAVLMIAGAGGVVVARRRQSARA